MGIRASLFEYSLFAVLSPEPKRKQKFNCAAAIAVIVLLAFFPATSAEAKGRGRKQQKGATADWARLQEQLPKWMAESHVPAVGLAVVEDGKLLHSHVFGQLTAGIPAPEDTIFEVASLTKPVAAVITLKLVDAGKWNLDEPLSHYWVDPDLAGDSRLDKVTSRLVLSHQTGFPNWRYWNRPTTKLGFDFDPGTKYQYSGEGYVYLRRAIEKKFRKTWSEIAAEALLSPLRLDHTTWYLDEAEPKPTFAVRHDRNGIPVAQDVIGEKRGSVVAFYTSPAGALVTTIRDYGTFAAHVAGGADLRTTTFREMVTPERPLPAGQGVALSSGLGWVIVDHLPGGEYALIHGGSEPGVRTFVVVLPNSKRAVVVLTNGDNGFDVCRRVIQTLPLVGPALVQRLAGYL